MVAFLEEKEQADRILTEKMVNMPSGEIAFSRVFETRVIPTRCFRHCHEFGHAVPTEYPPATNHTEQQTQGVRSSARNVEDCSPTSNSPIPTHPDHRSSTSPPNYPVQPPATLGKDPWPSQRAGWEGMVSILQNWVRMETG